jgi:phosphohistidine phosphatase
MKTLILLRHAKSSWSDGAASDIERGLKPKGERQAEKMARHLQSVLAPPDEVWCSSARRTRETLPPFAAAWGLDEGRIHLQEDLYLAGEDRLLKRVQSFPAKMRRALILGHNPGLADLANRLTPRKTYLQTIRPCGVVVIEFDVDSWTAVAPGTGRLALHLRPKEIEA